MENSILDFIPRLPVSEWISNLIDWLTANLAWLFGAIQDGRNFSYGYRNRPVTFSSTYRIYSYNGCFSFLCN